MAALAAAEVATDELTAVIADVGAAIYLVAPQPQQQQQQQQQAADGGSALSVAGQLARDRPADYTPLRPKSPAIPSAHGSFACRSDACALCMLARWYVAPISGIGRWLRARWRRDGQRGRR